MRGYDDLGPAHDLGYVQPDDPGDIGLREVDLGASQEGGDLAAFEILRDYLFMYAAEDGCGVDVVLRGPGGTGVGPICAA